MTTTHVIIFTIIALLCAVCACIGYRANELQEPDVTYNAKISDGLFVYEVFHDDEIYFTLVIPVTPIEVIPKNTVTFM